MDDIRERLRRLYAAVEGTKERDLSRVPGVIDETNETTYFVQDFSGDLTPETTSNLAHSAISLVAHLPDHLRRLARKLDHDPAEIDAVIEASPAVSILTDLANREKHGPPRDGGRSGRSPEIHRIQRRLRLSGDSGPGSGVQVQYTPSGPQVRGSGSASVIITGDVIDANGAYIGDLHSLLLEAVGSWEAILSRWLPSNDPAA